MRTDGLKLIAAGVLCAALACCAASGADKIFTDKERGFEITFPETWVIFDKRQQPNVPWIKFISDDFSGSVAVLIYDVDEGSTLKGFVDMALSRIRKLNAKCKIIDSTELKIG